MGVLANIGDLVERLTGNIEAVINDREKMQAEISSLRERLIERDKEAVKAVQDMRIELEAARMDVLCSEQERIRIEARLQGLNDRLIALAGDEKHCGG